MNETQPPAVGDTVKLLVSYLAWPVRASTGGPNERVGPRFLPTNVSYTVTRVVNEHTLEIAGPGRIVWRCPTDYAAPTKVPFAEIG